MPDTRVVHVLHSTRECEDLHNATVPFRMDPFEAEQGVFEKGDFALITAFDGCVLVGEVNVITEQLVYFNVS